MPGLGPGAKSRAGSSPATRKNFNFFSSTLCLDSESFFALPFRVKIFSSF